MILEREEGKEGSREREREETKGWEWGRERNIDVREKHRLAASGTGPNWYQASNPGLYPDQELNLQSFGAWDDVPTN